MAIYFDIIIPLEKVFNRIVALQLDEHLEGYCYYFNPKTKRSYKRIDFQDYDASDFNNPDYWGFYLISKEAKFTIDKSPHDNAFFTYAIEMQGGRETKTEIEQLRFRRCAKQPDKDTDKSYQKLQRSFSKDNSIGKGLHWGKHFYKRKYYEKDLKKRVWESFSNKNKSEIILPKE